MLAEVLQVETSSLLDEVEFYSQACGDRVQVGVYLCGVIIGVVEITTSKLDLGLTDEAISARLNNISQGV